MAKYQRIIKAQGTGAPIPHPFRGRAEESFVSLTPSYASSVIVPLVDSAEPVNGSIAVEPGSDAFAFFYGGRWNLDLHWGENENNYDSNGYLNITATNEAPGGGAFNFLDEVGYGMNFISKNTNTGVGSINFGIHSGTYLSIFDYNNSTELVQITDSVASTGHSIYPGAIRTSGIADLPNGSHDGIYIIGTQYGGAGVEADNGGGVYLDDYGNGGTYLSDNQGGGGIFLNAGWEVYRDESIPDSGGIYLEDFTNSGIWIYTTSTYGGGNGGVWIYTNASDTEGIHLHSEGSGGLNLLADLNGGQINITANGLGENSVMPVAGTVQLAIAMNAIAANNGSVGIWSGNQNLYLEAGGEVYVRTPNGAISIDSGTSGTTTITGGDATMTLYEAYTQFGTDGFEVDSSGANGGGIFLYSTGSQGVTVSSLGTSNSGIDLTMGGTSNAGLDITITGTGNGGIGASVTGSGTGGVSFDINTSGGSGGGFLVNAQGGTSGITLTSSSQLAISSTTLGFFGASPVAQPSAPTTLAQVITGLQSLGLFA